MLVCILSVLTFFHESILEDSGLTGLALIGVGDISNEVFLYNAIYMYDHVYKAYNTHLRLFTKSFQSAVHLEPSSDLRNHFLQTIWSRTATKSNRNGLAVHFLLYEKK